MAEPFTTSRPREAPAAEAAARIASRRKTADQRLRILERLTMGLSVAHIARVEQLTVRRVRQIIAEMIASRETDPPAGFVQLQVARLSEAMIVARTMRASSTAIAASRRHKFPLSRTPRRPDGSPRRGANCRRRTPRRSKPRRNFSWPQTLE